MFNVGSWVLGLLAESGRKKLTTLVLGSEQERALRSAAEAAVQLTARDVHPTDEEQAEQLVLVINQVFDKPAPEDAYVEHSTMLEALQSGIDGQLAVLDDSTLTGQGQSSAAVLGIPGAVLAKKLSNHLVREILTRASRGGPLEPLATQLNHDLTHLQVRQTNDAMHRIGAAAQEAFKRLGAVDAPAQLRLQPIRTSTSAGGPTTAQADSLEAPTITFPAPPEVCRSLVELLHAQISAAARFGYRLRASAQSSLSETYVESRTRHRDNPAKPVLSIAELASGNFTDHALLVGGAGYGKSSWMSQGAGGLSNSALARIEQPQSDATKLTIPVRVAAPELARQTGAWARAVTKAAAADLDQFVDRPLSDDTLLAVPDDARIVLLVDGLDEIFDPDIRMELIRRLISKAQAPGDRYQLIISTRPLPEDETRALTEGGLQPFDFLPFDRLQLDRFATAWFHRRDARLDRQFLGELARSGLEEPASVPLIATMAAIVFENAAVGGLPGNKHDLLHQLVGVLARAKKAEASAQIDSILDRYEGFETHDLAVLLRQVIELKGKMLKRLAYEQTFHRSTELLTAALTWVRNEVSPIPERVIPEFPVLLTAILAQTGLIEPDGHRLRFIHASLAEHLAASFVCDGLPDEFDPKHVEIAEWLEYANDGDDLAIQVIVDYSHKTSNHAALLTHLLADGPHGQHLAGTLIAEGTPHDDVHVRVLAQYTRGYVDPRKFSETARAPWWRLMCRIPSNLTLAMATDAITAEDQDCLIVSQLLVRYNPLAAVDPVQELATSRLVKCETRVRATLLLQSLGPEFADVAATAVQYLIDDGCGTISDIVDAVKGLFDRFPNARREVEQILTDLRSRTDLTVADQLLLISPLVKLDGEHTSAAHEMCLRIGNDRTLDYRTRKAAIGQLARLWPDNTAEAADLLYDVAADWEQEPTVQVRACRDFIRTHPADKERVREVLTRIAQEAVDKEIYYSAIRVLAKTREDDSIAIS